MNKCLILFWLQWTAGTKMLFHRSKRRRNIFKARKVTQASLWIQNSYQSFFKARVCVRIISWMNKPAPPVSHLSARKVIANISKTQKWFQLTSITSCKLHFESSQSLNLLDKLHTQPIFCFARIWHFWRRGRLKQHERRFVRSSQQTAHLIQVLPT